MNILDIIHNKRDGRALTTREIEWFVEHFTNGDIPDYQAAALLMAITIRGMSRRETVDLTMAVAASGDQLDLHDIAPFVVDKHSSGGVGDKTTLVVQPLVAACGVPVGKMSGRGLGSSGGTLDKMESFAGWSGEMTVEAFREQLSRIGLVLAGQSVDLAPADGKLYELRDVTGTVASIPLIAASIMSKKLAGGADGIVLDVKTGNGAFMRTLPEAEELARLMVGIGKEAGRTIVALISNMNQPLGHAIGNALEVREAIATLRGDDAPVDFWEHCLEVAGHMLVVAGSAESLPAAKQTVTKVRDSGKALARFRAMVEAQGGNPAIVDTPKELPAATLIEAVTAPVSGTIAAIDTMAIGWAAVNLGAGRHHKGERIDHAVGFVMPAKVGMRYAAGDTICTIYANDTARADAAHEAVQAAITWSDEPVATLPHFYGTIQ